MLTSCQFVLIVILLVIFTCNVFFYHVRLELKLISLCTCTAYRYHESSDDNRRCSRRRLYAATTLCVLFITTTVSIVIYQYVKTPEELLSDFHLMHHDDSVQPWHLVIMAGMSVVTLYSACAWSLPLACLIISCLLARDR